MRIFFALLLTSFFLKSFSQARFPALSAKGQIVQKVGFSTIEIEYERPAARGRIIFGDLVPYDKIWRTGAGNCPKIKFSDSVIVGGKTLGAGTYSLLSIPGKNEWTIILNQDTSLYGTDSYDKKRDVARFQVNSEKTSRYYESFTCEIDVVPNDAEIYLSWANEQVHFKVGTTSDKRTMDFIQRSLLTGKSSDPDEYATGAEYFIYRNTELDKALSLIDKAIQIKETAWYYRLKTDILENQKKYGQAIDLLQSLVVAAPKMSRSLGWNPNFEQEMIDGYNSRINSIRKKLAQNDGR